MMPKNIAAALAISAFAGLLVACEDQGPAEEVGEAMDDAAEEMGDTLEEAADAAEDATN